MALKDNNYCSLFVVSASNANDLAFIQPGRSPANLGFRIDVVRQFVLERHNATIDRVTTTVGAGVVGNRWSARGAATETFSQPPSTDLMPRRCSTSPSSSTDVQRTTADTTAPTATLFSSMFSTMPQLSSTSASMTTAMMITTPTNNTNNSGTTIGIVVGALAAVAVIVALLCLFLQRRRRRQIGAAPSANTDDVEQQHHSSSTENPNYVVIDIDKKSGIGESSQQQQQVFKGSMPGSKQHRKSSAANVASPTPYGKIEALTKQPRQSGETGSPTKASATASSSSSTTIYDVPRLTEE
jgi:hypothetical protein